MRERRRWLWGDGYPLAEVLGRLLADAPQLAVALGYANTTALLREGYGLDLVLGQGAGRVLKRVGQDQPQPAPGNQKLCACCGTPFQARRQDARYCSSTCRSRISRRRNQGRPSYVEPSHSQPSLGEANQPQASPFRGLDQRRVAVQSTNQPRRQRR
ncbi:hypothetical protein [Synechococcus sp. CS-603]|uniref:hypothetical protein n=1 Tax=Synechococcus sp. CS-603 TaxID=2847981 RepID=UPI00223B44C3|nr:hypothetical protein [Synechococcus sp. CS-603]MCT0201816.1 hypothetical protein [Synechococcus sp. CS-603]